MKKLIITIILAICLILPFTAQAITTYNANGLTGGTQRHLDYLSVADLNNGDRAVVLTGTIKYHFKYDSTATATDDNITTHPFKVRPDDYSSGGVWIEQELATGTIDAAMIATSGVDTAEIATSAVTRSKLNIPGLVVRPKFTWSASLVAVYLSSFTYDHQGTTEQLVYSASSILYTFGSTSGPNPDSTDLGASDWFYLYIDDSAVVTAATNLIAVAQLLAVTEEPVWSEAKHGRYGSVAAGNATATDRCIGGFLTDANAKILEFYHDGGDLVVYADNITDLEFTDYDDTWQDLTLSIPAFCTSAEINIGSHWVDGSTSSYWRTNGQLGSTGHYVARSGETSARAHNCIAVITDSDQIIEVRHGTSNANALEVYTQGWYFPTGM